MRVIIPPPVVAGAAAPRVVAVLLLPRSPPLLLLVLLPPPALLLLLPGCCTPRERATSVGTLSTGTTPGEALRGKRTVHRRINIIFIEGASCWNKAEQREEVAAGAINARWRMSPLGPSAEKVTCLQQSPS